MMFSISEKEEAHRNQENQQGEGACLITDGGMSQASAACRPQPVCRA